MSLKSSVIICTRNRPKDILLCLKSLAHQTVFPNQIIVVDSSDSALNTHAEFVATFHKNIFAKSQLLYVHTKPGLTYQRNQGITRATNELIYFFDDDVIIEPTYLQEMNISFENNSSYMGGMGAVTNIKPKKNNLSRALYTFFLLPRDYSSGKFTVSGMPTHPYGEKTFKTIEVLGGCCMAFRSSIFKQHLFDEQLQRYAYMEDCDIARRISYNFPLFFNPNARLQHFASPLARDAEVDNRAMFIKNYSYLFFKNFYSRNKLKLIAYAWSIFGLFVIAVLFRQKNYLKGYWQGLKSYYR